MVQEQEKSNYDHYVCMLDFYRVDQNMELKNLV